MASIQNSVIVNVDEIHYIKAIEMAEQRIKTEYKRDASLNKNQRIEKIVIGYIGEFIFKEWCDDNKINYQYLGEKVTNSPDNGDFLINDTFIDVKTQDIKYRPKDNWRCEVTAEQIKRPIDIYVFAKLYSNHVEKTLYLIGWVSKKEFLRKAIYRPAGAILKGRKVRYPKYDVLIEQLNHINSLNEYLKTGGN